MAGTKTAAKPRARRAPEPTPAPGVVEVPEGLYARLLDVATEVGRIEKNGRNEHHRYDYVQASDVTERVGDLLHARRVLVVPQAKNARHEGVLTTVDLLYRFVAVDTGETLEVEWVGVGFDKGGDKGVYKAMTGGLKYVLLNLFLIPTGDDPEQDRTTDPRGAAPTSRNTVPPIPTDRATRLAERCQAAGVKGAVLKAKLAEIGVAGISTLNVDQAEAFEAWLADEEAQAAA